MCGTAGLDAHGVEFRDLFRQRQQAGHGAKRPPLVVEVQAGDDDADASVGQRVAHVGQAVVEELGFVHAHDGHGRAGIDVLQQGLAAGHHGGRHRVAVVAHHFLVRVPRVGGGLEQFKRKVGDLGPPNAAEQFLRLARKHGSTDNFKSSFSGWQP